MEKSPGQSIFKSCAVCSYEITSEFFPPQSRSRFWLELFLRRAQRRARLRSSFDDPAYRERREAEIKRRAGANEVDEAAN
jgi:hypothetical protein